MNRKRTLTAVLTAGAIGAGAIGTLAVQTPSADAATHRVSGCVGKSLSGTLKPGKAICNGNYLVRMQPNGDLVLRQISTGRACWRSGTDRAPGADTSATFHSGIPGHLPYISLDSTSQGQLTKIWGGRTWLHQGSSANVNTKGEFWIGYEPIGSC